MRRISLLLCAFLLAVPAVALGTLSASGDGSLVVSGASTRIIVVEGRGLLFGHITQGTITVLDYQGADSSAAQVSGTTMVKLPVDSATRYSGADIRFLFPNGRYSLRFEGIGIDISAVGKGAVSAIGVGTASDGTMATNGGKGVPLGSTPTTLVFGSGKAPNTSPASVTKGSPRQ